MGYILRGGSYFMLGAALLLSACKKESLAPVIPPTLPAPSQFHGFFRAVKFVSNDSVSGNTTSYQAHASLYKQAVESDSSTALYGNAGYVYLNGRELPFQDYLNFYYSNSIIPGATYNWRMAGNADLAGFTFNSTRPLPSFYEVSIPYTISISKGAQLQISSVNNSDAGSIVVHDAYSSFTIVIRPGSSKVVLSPQQLSGLSGSGWINVELMNRQTALFEKKYFWFGNESVYIQRVRFVP